MKLCTRIRLLLLIHPFISSCFSLQFSTLKCLVTFFSGTVRPRRLKLGTYVDSGQMYYVYRNQAAAAYSSLYFFICLSPIFNIKIFRHTFLGYYEAKIENWYTRGQWADVSCIPDSGCCCLFIPLFIFLSVQFSTLKFIITLFSGTVRPRRFKLDTHVDSGQMYHVYWNQSASAYSSN